MRPLRSAMNRRPSGAGARSVGSLRPSATTAPASRTPSVVVTVNEPLAADEVVCAIRTTSRLEERGLSRRLPSVVMYDEIDSECCPALIGGRRLLHAYPAGPGVAVQETSWASVGLTSTYIR